MLASGRTRIAPCLHFLCPPPAGRVCGQDGAIRNGLLPKAGKRQQRAVAVSIGALQFLRVAGYGFAEPKQKGRPSRAALLSIAPSVAQFCSLAWLRQDATRARLHRIIHIVLDRVRGHFVAHVFFHAQADVGVDHVVVHDAALLQVVAILVEAIERLAK